MHKPNEQPFSDGELEDVRKRVLESIGLGILVCDKQGRLLAADAMASDMLGMDAPVSEGAGILGGGLSSFIGSAAAEEVLSQLRQGLQVRGLEWQVPGDSGGGRRLRADAFPVEGKATCVFALRSGPQSGDVRDANRLDDAQDRQQQLIQAGKLASLGYLVSGLAHEVNNPNHLILANVELLKDAWEGGLPILDRYYDENGDFLLAGLPYSELRSQMTGVFEDMWSAAKRVQRIVQELRDYARQRPGRGHEPVDLNGVIAAAVALTRNLIKRSTPHFHEGLQTDLPMVLGDPQRMEQVIINLLINACHAVEQRAGAIHLRTAHEPGADCVVVEVADEGVGMTPAVLKHATDPFYTTKREEGGTGLGLAICASIMQEHRGTMHFDSTPGAGATVTLVFRAHDPGDPAEPPRAAETDSV